MSVQITLTRPNTAVDLRVYAQGARLLEEHGNVFYNRVGWIESEANVGVPPTPYGVEHDCWLVRSDCKSDASAALVRF